MKMSVQAMFDLGVQCLRAVNVPEKTAQCVSKALLKAELDGMPSHGFVRIPFYAAQVRSGKLRAWVRPVVTHPAPATTLVNARYGFAFPAIEEGLELAVPLARQYGIALLGVQNSHHCGMLGHYVEDVARQGLVCLAFSNTPAAMAPWGGRRASFGTNPLAFACPRSLDGEKEPIVVDMSLSKVARGKILAASERGDKCIPAGWALDSNGRPTENPDAALKGTMVPMGDAKGAALALVVEILAATLTGSNHAFEASSFFDAEGAAPSVGQSFVIMDPQGMNPIFGESLERLANHILSQPGARLPGSRRFLLRRKNASNELEIPDNLYKKLLFFSIGNEFL